MAVRILGGVLLEASDLDLDWSIESISGTQPSSFTGPTTSPIAPDTEVACKSCHHSAWYIRLTGRIAPPLTLPLPHNSTGP